MKNWLMVASTCGALLGCTSQPTVAQTEIKGKRHAIQIDDMTLYVQSPSLLRPSKDFPPPKIASEFRLDQVDKPRTLFSGYWDGPRYQMLSVSGTMSILMSVSPWPAESQGAVTCSDKARAVADIDLAREMRHYEKGYQSSPPSLAFEPTQLAGRQSYYYKLSSNQRFYYYIIPLTGSHYIDLLITSADNSPFKGEWPELFSKAQAAFLQSLELVGGDEDCR